MEQAASSSSTAPHHNVEVVELDQEDLELEHQHELERELNHLTKSIISTSELQKQETRKGKAILQSAPEEEDEPTSPIFEPSYQALKLALSLSEGQLENKRRRMSAIDENRASGHNHGHVGHQIFTDSHGNPTMAEGISNTPIYDELKHKEPSMIGTIQPPASAAKIVTSPALDSKPLVPSPLRNEQSPDDPVLTTMPSAEEEMSPTASSPRKFFTRRTLRSGSRTRAAPHTRVRQEAPTLPTGAIRGESPAIVDTSKPTSPLSSFMAEAAKRSGELRRRVSSAGGKKSAKKPKLTRMQRQEVKNLAQKTATQEKDGVQNSPTAVLAAMLAVGATATAVPATLQEEGAENRDSEQTLVGQEDPAAVKETEVPAKAEKEAEKGFFRTRSMRSKAAKNVPAKKDENEGLKEKSATKTIPAPLSFFRRTSQQSVAKSAESGGVGKSNTTRLQAWGATFNTPKAASNTHTPPVVESATQSSEVQAEPAITKAETKPGFFKRLSMRSATSAEEPSSNAPTEITSTAPQIEESVIKPQTDAEIAAKLAVASSAPFVIPTKKNPTRSQPVEAVKPDLASTTTPTLQAFNDPTSKPLEQDAGEASTPKKSSIPRPISIGNPASGPPSPSPAQNPLEPKPRTHVHFARKRGESDCTLCAPEYLQAGTIPAAARVSTELPSVMEAAPTPSVPMVPTSIGTKAMAGAQRTSGESTKARQADADMRTSSFRRSKIPKMIGSGYRGFAANTPTLRKQKSPSPAAANISTGETAEKTPSNRRPRPVNPFRRTARSAANQPELPMLAIALAPSPPIAAAIPEEEPSTPLAELPDTSATHVPKGTTPFSQQRFFRRRSLRTTPSTSTAGKAPPPLPARNLLTETETSAEQQPTAADKTMRRFGSPHKPFFRGRSKRTRRQKSPAPLRKVAQRERFSLEDPEFASSRSKPKTVGARGAAGQWLKRKSVRSSSLFTEPQANEAVVAAPLHEFESLPRRLSVPAVEVPEAEPSAKAKGKRRGERSSSSETPAAGIDTAAVETPVHEFEPLPRRISESTAETETGTKKKATGKSKNLRKRAVARAKRVVKFLQRGSRPRTPPKTKEPARETPVIAVAAPTQEAAAVPVAAPIQEASSTLPTDGGLGASTVTSAASEKGRRSRLPIPLFSKRSMRTKTTPRGPLRAPPALPPRNEPQIPDAQTEGVVPALPPRDDTQVPVAQTEGVIAAPSSCNNSPASAEQMTTEPSATRAVVEDEITPVVETEKVHHDAASDTVESGLQYTREPKKLITYLIPLPMPVLQTGIADEEDVSCFLFEKINVCVY